MSTTTEPNWDRVSEILKENGYDKTAKQCRERWVHQVNPDLSKKKWTDDDSKILFDLHKVHGSHWKVISKSFPGRTDNFLKNQFFSLIRRSLRRICKFLKIPKGEFLWDLIIFFWWYYIWYLLKFVFLIKIFCVKLETLDF